MSEVSMTMMYAVTVTKPDGKTETWTFLNANDKDDFIDYLDELSSECEFEIDEDSWFANSLEGAKHEAESFLGLDTDDDIDDTDKQVCARWPNGD